MVQLLVFFRSLIGKVNSKVNNFCGKIRRSLDWFTIFELVALVVVLGITFEFWSKMELSLILAYIEIKKKIVEIMLSIGCPRIDIIAMLFPID